MCQHALCEHGKQTNQLSPLPPSLPRSLTLYASILVPLALLLWLPLFGQLWIPLSVQATLVALFLTSLLIRSATYRSTQLTPSEKQSLLTSEHAAWLARTSSSESKLKHARCLARAIQVETVSFDPPTPQLGGSAAKPAAASDAPKTDGAAFLKLHALLAEMYPLTHQTLERTVINEYSLLYHWRGSASPQTSPPYMLSGHLDVVPAADPHLWETPPFSGEITKDGLFVCGRGAIDDKQAVCGILGAVEDLLSHGFQPRRDVYVCFGHDEEIGGQAGARQIAAELLRRKVHFSFMLDEGLFVMKNILPGLEEAIAMVCIAEKGFLVNEITANVPASLAGHASAPGRESAVGILSKALLRMEQNPMPAYLIRGSPVRLMFDSLAPHFTGAFRVLFCNLWLFAPVLKLILTLKSITAPMVRTTTALTVLQAGNRPNVVPREARALVNHRIHPLDSVDGVMEYSRSVIADPRVTCKNLQSIPPAPVSSTTSEGFRTIQQALGRALPDVLVAPALMIGNTDTFQYWKLCDDIYRFSPTRLNPQTVSMFHGANERMSVDNFTETIGFYRAVIQIADAGGALGKAK
jgi:carboxypeptidase PM20D1